MRKGKHPFAEGEPIPGESESEGYAVPDESAFLSAASRARCTPTPREAARLAAVRTLFQRVKPGLPIDSDPPELRQEPTPLGHAIETILQRLELRATPWLDDLAAAWHEILPPQVSRFTRPGKYDAGILFVFVTSSTHLFEIRRNHLQRIEQAVRAFAGDERQIRQVRLMVDSVPIP
ncbi:MAG TPA: DUF721 domain-containing protein [Kiritimatiellia bacterium]|jgi:hypothetical protein|nr:DUF721 domain-containing protein [Kiritimatiellia bacterium]HOM59320.1 DUF721 domain-containing protein [Kiritimatiellia bacterium]HOR97359.1 DUF721 domain-containing protein [Kiritimatiellia bacterium]HPC48851.1 DUF721 domain-containing protein [Kiritimatiellia bacterium]HPK37511.1 DUF721 domain-containing protein [Kiritimatiellia bacterium]